MDIKFKEEMAILNKNQLSLQILFGRSYVTYCRRSKVIQLSKASNLAVFKKHRDQNLARKSNNYFTRLRANRQAAKLAK